jgi:hypothetical protein
MATPKKPRYRKGPDEPTVPAGVKTFESWKPGERPPWLGPVLDALVPHDQYGGRHHPKWSENAQDAIIGAVAGCGSYVHAASIAGISKHTATEWLNRGRADQQAWEARLAAGEVPDDPTEWHVFARAVTLASGYWAGRKIAELQRLGEDPATPVQLRAAILQWLLSRIGDKLTERVEVEHSGEVTTTVSDMADAMREKFAQIRERAAAVQGEDA